MPPVRIPRQAHNLTRTIGVAIAELAIKIVRRHKFAKTLKRDLEIQETPDAVYLGVPHYWAPYYHDGRGTVRPRGSRRVLVWFRDPLRNDPRLKGRFPVYKTELKRLTKEQFQAGLRANKLNPGNPVMIVALESPRGGGFARSNPFFDRAFDKLLRPREESQMASLAETQLTNFMDRAVPMFRKIAGSDVINYTYQRRIRVTLSRL